MVGDVLCGERGEGRLKNHRLPIFGDVSSEDASRGVVMGEVSELAAS